MAIFGIYNLIKLIFFIAAIVMITVGLIKLSRKNRERRQEAIHQLLNGREQGDQNTVKQSNGDQNNNGMQ